MATINEKVIRKYIEQLDQKITSWTSQVDQLEKNIYEARECKKSHLKSIGEIK